MPTTELGTVSVQRRGRSVGGRAATAEAAVSLTYAYRRGPVARGVEVRVGRRRTGHARAR